MLTACGLTLGTLVASAPPGLARPLVQTVQLAVQVDGNLGPVVMRHGFLHGLDGTAGYDADKVALLRPRHWRLGKYASYAFASRYDVAITYGLSGPFAWSRGGFPEVSPWEDWAAWEDFVRLRIAELNASFPEHLPVYYDIWNEGDHAYFWHGTDEQLLELFARTAAIVRANAPEAKLVGPSASWYRPGRAGVADVPAFLAALGTRWGVRLDAVSWHENHTATPNVIVDNARRIRRDLQAHFGDAYRPELHVNEMMGTEVHSQPGWNVGYLYYLEQAEVDASMRACWSVYEVDADREQVRRYSDCWAGLNGMFLADGRTEQPAYWVVRAYAETEGEIRLPVTPGRHTTTALASRDDANRRVRLVVGRHGGVGRADVALRLDGWPWEGAILASAARIPTYPGFTGNPSQAVGLPEGPLPVFERRLRRTEGTLRLTLPSVGEGEAWIVDLRPAPRLWLPRVLRKMR